MAGEKKRSGSRRKMDRRTSNPALPEGSQDRRSDKDRRTETNRRNKENDTPLEET